MPQYGEMTGAPPLVVIAGATATGKTDLAIRLAEAIRRGGRPVTVISADSRQVYRGLDIGTAKVGAEDRARVPHAGLDLVDPPESFSVADFADHARSVLGDLAARDGVAILAGGTGLYLRAVARGIDLDALPHDPTVRAELEAEVASAGLEPLVERLRATAPGLAGAIDRANPRRVVRALEIAVLRGDGLRPTPRGYPGPVTWIGLAVEPAALARRIEERARAQFAAGLVEEAVRLRDRFDPTLPAFSAIGYHEAWAVADGTSTLEAAIELDAARNRTFAKRQRTWFRKEPDIVWIDATHEDPLDDALEAAREVAG
jgi:tRNA dimethylallyltransferase